MKMTHHLRGSGSKGAWIIAVIASQSLFSFKLHALPLQGEVTAGLARVTNPTIQTMLIQQESNNAVINWKSFNIKQGEALTVAQPSGNATLLNHVIGTDPSTLYGTIQANGRLFLINPNGMIIGKGASLNTGGLVASTLSLDTDDFLKGNYAFQRNSGAVAASLLNQGDIAAGFVALLGNSVANDGSIKTCGTAAALATGDKVMLEMGPTGLLALHVGESALQSAITNNGHIETEQGTILLTGSGIDGLVGSVINNTGIIHAGTIAERDGTIVIEGGSIINSGTISASQIETHGNNLLDAGHWNAAAQNHGGSIIMLMDGTIEQTSGSSMSANGAEGGSITLKAGNTLFLSGTATANGSETTGGTIILSAPATTIAGANIESNGTNGGGAINIGGGWQGKDPAIPNARQSIITASTTINNNARENGDGGTVVIWSDEKTIFSGTINATGGDTAGNGGNAEISGAQQLAMNGSVNLKARQGNSGKLLLDPKNLTIMENSSTLPYTIVPLADPEPAAGDQHGSGGMLELSNGNLAVASPLDDFTALDAGAIRLYKPDGTLLSVLTGSSANDQVGSLLIPLTGNSNFIASSPLWSNGSVSAAGAVTWINGTTGTAGTVSELNSLVGTTTGDGNKQQLLPLTNGNYVVASPGWDNQGVIDAGAVTWGNGSLGTAGTINADNSLVGSSANDSVSLQVAQLTNGNYVVAAPLWDNAGAANAGAVTWGDGINGTTGPVTQNNSLTGIKTGDNVGMGITALGNGNYVIASPNFDSGSITNAGAVTWVDGTVSVSGAIDPATSLVGATTNDRIGTSVTPLANGNYVVVSTLWDNGSITDTGAFTLGDGASGTTGTVTAANSLTGTSIDDGANATVTPLATGDYVVVMPGFDNGPVADTGALHMANGQTVSTGNIDATNSITGLSATDGAGMVVTPLNNGNYVISAPGWDNGTTTDVGAISWQDGTVATTGTIEATNSLTGATTGDLSGHRIVELANGNYVVAAPKWDNASVIDAGAVTWANGTGPVGGIIAPVNSLTGSAKNDLIGSDTAGTNRIIPLANGNYLIVSPMWDKGTTANAGAVTWSNGENGITGSIDETNSLVGTKTGDQVGTVVTALPDGSYVVASPSWDNGSLSNAGAITPGDAAGNLVGTISTTNSIPGSNKDDLSGSGGIIPIMSPERSGGFLVSSMNSAGNTGSVSLVVPGTGTATIPQEYGLNPDTDAILTPETLTTLLDAGTDVVMKANNTITINSPVTVNNPAGDGGSLDINAGNSIVLNAPLFSDNGNLTIIGNNTAAEGVVDNDRLPGTATITMGPDSSIDAGNGSVTITLNDGEGLTNHDSGTITLRSISAGTITAINNGNTAGSGITLASGTLNASNTDGNSIILASENLNNAAGATLTTAGTARWLIYAADPALTVKGPLSSSFRHYGDTFATLLPDQVAETGNGFIYATAPDELQVNIILASGSTTSTYGSDPVATYGYTLSGFSDNEENSTNIGLGGTMAVTGVPTATSDTGTYTITYAGGLESTAGFTFSPGAGLIHTVDKQDVTVTTDPQDKTYGNTDPALTWQVEGQSNGRGLIPGDILTGELNRTPGEDVATYEIFRNTLDNNNYDITYTGNYLTINPRPITLGAIQTTTVYGEADSALEVTILAGSLGSTTVTDTLTDVTGTLVRQAGQNAGNYDILLGTGNKASNYDITFETNNQAFAIQPRPVSIEAIAQTKIYGENDPALLWNAETPTPGRGLLEGDTLTGALDRTAGENVADYAISQNTLENSNYLISYTGADLTITPRPVDIAADAQTKTYGDADPALTWSAEAVTPGRGLLDGDTLNGALSRAAGEDVNPANYAIDQNTLSNSNYTINYTGNELTITPRKVTLQANNSSKVYGEQDPVNSVTITEGSLGSTTVTDTIEEVTGTLGRDAGDDVGTYNIQLGTGSKAGNYEITFDATNQAFAITKRPVNISASAVNKIYGDPDPELSWQAEAPAPPDGAAASAASNSGTVPTVPDTVGTTTDPVLNGSLMYADGFLGGNSIIITETATQAFQLSLPPDLFVHSNPDAVITIDVGTVNGAPAPSWMSYDAVNQTISGTPPPEAVGDYEVEIIAHDQFGSELRTTILLQIN